MALSPTRRARLDAELTMFDMFKKTRIQPSRLSLIERGLVEARADERDRIGKALHANTADLFPAAGLAEQQPAGDAV